MQAWNIEFCDRPSISAFNNGKYSELATLYARAREGLLRVHKKGELELSVWTRRAHRCADEVTRIWASDVVREYGFAPNLRVAGLGAVQLEATYQAIGGQRYWFRCPRCHQRRAWLAAAGDVGTCRTCSNIVYRSQCLSNFNRRTRRAEQIYDLINVEYAPLTRTQGKKPYGMRWRTYWRLFDQAQAIDPWHARIEKRYRHGRGLRVKKEESGSKIGPSR